MSTGTWRADDGPIAKHMATGKMAARRWKVFRKLWYVLVRAFQEAQADNIPRMAAAIAFYSAISIAPLMLIVIIIAGFIWGAEDSVRAELLGYVSRVVNPRAADFIRTALQNATRPSAGSIAGLISAATIIWGATNTFNHIHRSLNDIWEVPGTEEQGVMDFVRSRFFALAMVLVVAFLLLLSLLISTLLSAASPALEFLLPGGQSFWQWTNLIVSFVVVMLFTAMIFRILPAADITWRDVWLGAALTALLFTIGQTLLGLYLSRIGSTYGAAGSVIAFLFWVYFSAQALLFGAEVAKVYTDARHMTEAANAKRPATQAALAEDAAEGTTAETTAEPEKVKASTEPAQPRLHHKV